MVTADDVLKALDKPRTLNSLLTVVNPGGSQNALQDLLLQMRERGQVRFDINRGLWRRA